MKTLVLEDPNKIWFTSDTHFGHDNIREFCNRPFKSVGEMNKVLVHNWNSVVDKHDLVIHGGDFCWGNTISWLGILDQLNGIKILVQGNHDKDGTIPKTKFQCVYTILNLRVIDPEIKGGEQRITVCHYPMLSWYQSHRGAWQLFGHWHNTKVCAPGPNNENIMEANLDVAECVKEEYLYMDKIRPSQYDIGVDGNDFTPISYQAVKKIIQYKNDLRKGAEVKRSVSKE